MPVLGGAGQTILFAKIGMAPRLFARELLVILPGFPGRLNGVENARVARAAAQMSIQRLRHLLAIVRAVCCSSPEARITMPGNAEPALHRAFQQERLAQHPAHVLRHAFERDYVAALHVFRLAQAREHRLTVHQHRAAAARAFRSAAVLSRNDVALLAQDFEKVHARLVRHRGRIPV